MFIKIYVFYAVSDLLCSLTSNLDLHSLELEPARVGCRAVVFAIVADLQRRSWHSGKISASQPEGPRFNTRVENIRGSNIGETFFLSAATSKKEDCQPHLIGLDRRCLVKSRSLKREQKKKQVNKLTVPPACNWYTNVPLSIFMWTIISTDSDCCACTQNVW